MMKTLLFLFKTLIISLIAFSTLSCSSEENPVSFKIRGGTTMLVPSTAKTCKEDAEPVVPETRSLQKSYFRFEAPEIEFDAKLNKGVSTTINIVGITLTIKSGNVGGKYSCVIAGDELKYLYYNSTLNGEYWDPVNITYNTASSKFTSTSYWVTDRGYKSCALKCGGVPAKEVAFTVPVNLEVLVVVTTVNEDGSVVDTPYKASTTGIVANAF